MNFKKLLFNLVVRLPLVLGVSVAAFLFIVFRVTPNLVDYIDQVEGYPALESMLDWFPIVLSVMAAMVIGMVIDKGLGMLWRVEEGRDEPLPRSAKSHPLIFNIIVKICVFLISVFVPIIFVFLLAYFSGRSVIDPFGAAIQSIMVFISGLAFAGFASIGIYKVLIKLIYGFVDKH